MREVWESSTVVMECVSVRVTQLPSQFGDKIVFLHIIVFY
jgi:hypothetical protein